jgi:diadenosine tetraphosphatase ApaH/serine/threonine PP2A family protein phosphatase
LFAIINEAVLVVHGGIFHTQDALLSEMNAINRVEFSLRDMPEGGEKLDQIPRFKREDYLKQLARDALWSDPMDAPGIEVNVRGAGVAFGPDRVKAFLEVNSLKMIVRSHECVGTGFDYPFSGGNSQLLCTIFSASNYGGGGNSGAYLVFTKDPNLNKSEARKDPEEVDAISSRNGTELTRVPENELYYSTFYFGKG